MFLRTIYLQNSLCRRDRWHLGRLSAFLKFTLPVSNRTGFTLCAQCAFPASRQQPDTCSFIVHEKLLVSFINCIFYSKKRKIIYSTLIVRLCVEHWIIEAAAYIKNTSSGATWTVLYPWLLCPWVTLGNLFEPWLPSPKWVFGENGGERVGARVDQIDVTFKRQSKTWGL